MADESRALPVVLAEAHRLGFFEDHDGHDFQPEAEFEWPGETAEWWRLWTGDPAAGEPPLRVFGVDGSGGKMAFWDRTGGMEIETQPIVFLGSEGELCVLARDLGDYLWLLAHGVGPLEPVDGVHRLPEPVAPLVALAQRYTGRVFRSLAAVMDAARAELPPLTAFVVATTR
ncbi:SMI1/KNR4 family protein [Dactylosporangium sp. NPDC000244]|uniref:SMI1/KNR4 family protein n=1 Tax=Dactylosporangium sp. NPDC000244 TaxID=3154365 RepID=UPI0033233AF7